jgi:hypothetical protein
MGARMFGAALRLYFDYLPRESSSFILRFSCGKVSDHLVEMPLKNKGADVFARAWVGKIPEVL